MKPKTLKDTRKFVLCVAAISLLAGAAAAHDYKIGMIEIRHPWTRATPKGAQVATGYMTITNKGAAADRLVGGSSTVAGRFEIHRMTMEQGVMKMRPVKGGLEIKPGATVELKPESLHIMMMNLKQPLKSGQRVKGTLIFDKAGKVDIEYVVEVMGAPDASGGHMNSGQHSGH